MFNVECPVIKVVNKTGVDYLPQDRTTIGVAEEIKLLTDTIYGKTTWKVTKSAKGRSYKLIVINDNELLLKANVLDDEITVTAYITKNSCKNAVEIMLKIIQPTGLFFENICDFHQKDTNNVGFTAKIYIKPDNVSFENLKLKEKEVPGIAYGALLPLNGIGHSPNPLFILGTKTIVKGKGTFVDARDCIYWNMSKYPEPVLDTGTFLYNIPWVYQEITSQSTGAYPFVTVLQIGKFERKLFNGKLDNLLIEKKDNAEARFYKSEAEKVCNLCFFKK
jgi:hypothetical protein